jgi:hypothetical protein
MKTRVLNSGSKIKIKVRIMREEIMREGILRMTKGMVKADRVRTKI